MFYSQISHSLFEFGLVFVADTSVARNQNEILNQLESIYHHNASSTSDGESLTAIRNTDGGLRKSVELQSIDSMLESLMKQVALWNRKRTYKHVPRSTRRNTLLRKLDTQITITWYYH